MIPQKAFPRPGLSEAKTIWRAYIGKEQDLNCFSCQRASWQTIQVRKKMVGLPLHISPHLRYNSRIFLYHAEDQKGWTVAEDADRELQCLLCSEQKPIQNTDDARKYLCLTCERKLPYFHFVQAHLSTWKHQNTVERAAEGARCYTQRRTNLADDIKLTCKICRQIKHIRGFSCITSRIWMEEKHVGSKQWTCYDCHSPSYGLYKKRPMHPLLHDT